MFWNKNKPKEGDLRITEKYNRESRCSTFAVERYEQVFGYDYYGSEWVSKSIHTSMEKALAEVPHVRRAAEPKHYLVK